MNQYAFYLHVDDGLFLGGGQTSGGTDLLVETTANGLQETGFMVKSRTRAQEMKTSLGYDIHGALGRVSYPLDRAHLLRESLLWMSSQAAVSTHVLASVVGMWIHGALLRRELLSIPRDIFKFLDWGGGRRCIWWKGARREAVAMAEAVAFMHADVCVRPWPR